MSQNQQENNLKGRLTSVQSIREDSLISLLKETLDPHKRINLLLNLKDVTEGKENETNYTLQLFEESRKAKDVFGVFVGVTHLVTRYANHQEKRDSLLNYYIKTLSVLEKGTPAEGSATFFQMNMKTQNISSETDKRQRAILSEQIHKELETRRPTENKFEKVERLVTEGVISLYALADQGKDKIYVPEIPLWEEAWETAQDFPEYIRRYYLGTIHYYLSGSYNQIQNYEKQQKITAIVIQAYKDFYEFSSQIYPRPFLYKDNVYVRHYTQLIRGAMYVSDEEAYKIYNIFRDHMLSAQGDFLDRNKIYLYETAYLFLSRMNRPDEAMANCDSLIAMIESGHAPGYKRILRAYKDKARLFLQANQPQKACSAYERAMQISDSLINKEYVERVETMRLRHDIDTLQLEKTNLLARHRQVAFIFSICILFIAILISFYYYKTFKKTQSLQKEILRQNVKAQESEQMKSAFINSICHEVRTPLNAINGFSEILTDDSSNIEEKKEYQQIIKENTHLLTTLLDSLIEVANLDSLTENLSLEKTELTWYCRNEMQYLQNTEGKSEIDYRLELPEEGCFTLTHPQYFSLLIRSLLNNANKFTRQGSISLLCLPDEQQQTVSIIVTDTGCGIPADKHEYIFQRFTKLDTFTHGNGLGLYLCRLIAQHMNGDICIDNTYTNGARFIFTIPLKSK